MAMKKGEQMTKVKVSFDLDDLTERLHDAMEVADAHDVETVRINRATWVMARSLCDRYAEMRTAVAQLANGKPGRYVILADDHSVIVTDELMEGDNVLLDQEA